jgi:hypothetical protein
MAYAGVTWFNRWFATTVDMIFTFIVAIPLILRMESSRLYTLRER